MAFLQGKDEMCPGDVVAHQVSAVCSQYKCSAQHSGGQICENVYNEISDISLVPIQVHVSTCMYITWLAHVHHMTVVSDRKQILFHCIFDHSEVLIILLKARLPVYHVDVLIVDAMCMTPPLNRSSTIWCFECIHVIKINVQWSKFLIVTDNAW